MQTLAKVDSISKRMQILPALNQHPPLLDYSPWQGVAMPVAVKYSSAKTLQKHLIGGHSLAACLNVNESSS